LSPRREPRVPVLEDAIVLVCVRTKSPTHWPQRQHTMDDLKCVKSRIEFEEPLRVD
jgi:hypothetical protein